MKTPWDSQKNEGTTMSSTPQSEEAGEYEERKSEETQNITFLL